MKIFLITHYSLVNLEYHKDLKNNLNNFQYIFFVFIILFFISIYNWNQRRVTEKENKELLIKYKMIFDACPHSILLLNNSGELLEINEKLRRKIGAPTHYFENKEYKEIITNTELYKLMIENVEEKDISHFENTQDCELVIYSGKKIKAKYDVNAVKIKEGYLYVVNIKNFQDNS